MAKDPTKRQEQGVARIRRGELYLVSFDPTVGHEIQKTRPALVIQNDIGNQYSPVTIVAAITSTVRPHPYPIEVLVTPSPTNGLRVQSSIRFDQIRTVDRQRLIKRLGSIDGKTMDRADEAIKISLGLIEV